MKDRFRANSIPYSYDIILEYKDEADKIWKLEKQLHREYKEFKYMPKITFGGMEECFDLNISIEEIKKDLEVLEKL